MQNDDNTFSLEDKIFKPASAIINDFIKNIDKLAEGPNPQNIAYVLEPIARQSFKEIFGFEPQAGEVDNKNIEKTPQERIKMTLEYSDLYGHDSHLKEVARLENQDKKNKETKEQWFELAEEIEKEEIEKLVEKMELKIKDLVNETENAYQNMKNTTIFLLGSLIKENCSIKKIEIDKTEPIHLFNGEDSSVSILELNKIEQYEIEGATNLIVPSVDVTAKTIEGIKLTIKIKDTYNVAIGVYKPDDTILIDEALLDIKNKVTGVVLSKWTEQNKKRPRIKFLHQKAANSIKKYHDGIIELSQLSGELNDINENLEKLGIKQKDQTKETPYLGR